MGAPSGELDNIIDFGVTMDPDLLMKVYPVYRQGGAVDQYDHEMEALYFIDYMIVWWIDNLRKQADTGARFEDF
jgi:hypothetical protein